MTKSLLAPWWALALFCGALSLSAKAQPLAAHQGLDATAWVQTSAEWKIASRQAYRLASRQLDAALRDKSWSASIEQVAPFGKLPPAVILDLDETVIDNSPFQARLVQGDAAYTGAAWARWVAEANASALPGAVEFLTYANAKGVRIFYVSNRERADEAGTRENLRKLGCPLQGPDDHILLAGERPEWTTDKTSRRRFIAQNHRVLMLVGDDLNDFVPAKPMSLQTRLDLFQRYDGFWGERWVLLSNPLYGSWEGAILDYKNDLSRQEILRRKYGALQTREPLVPPVSASPQKQ